MANQYERISTDLRRQIGAGELAPGDKLPAETTLAEIYGVSVPTVRQGVGVLQAEGLVEKQHGRGTFVRKQPTPVKRNNERHQWEKDRAREPESERQKTGATEHDTGLTLNDLVFRAEYDRVPAPADLAELFGVPEGTTLLERTYRTRYSEERSPFNIARSYLVLDVVSKNPDLLSADQEPWPGGTQNQLFTLGIELDRIVETFRARPPTPEETEELGLPVGVSVVILRKTSIDTNDRVVEVSDVVLPGDRTEMVYTTKLSRW
ncbi:MULTISPECIES: GntR family transcriptional regulator [Streptomycetaceae]|uniref:GntR family transcriptional regulator n=2 Tax=Actinomycetes TaxID=1760 RepID=A0A561ESR0_9ACTN|nr:MULTISPECIES: GntR family transcriptional regulator [Streptomycetaceae]TWE18621.1 GntR family transcriptional regulator [Kitasatospora atroaurantiaca]